jgi:adenylate cyclase
MVEEVWRDYLTKGQNEKEARQRRLFKWFPTNPPHARCKNCCAPFQGVGAPVVRALYNKRPSIYNPRFCNICEEFARDYQGGAEIEMSMLFADIRGSTTLAEGMSPTEFSKLIDRFYQRTTDVLIEADALIDKLVGDEVTAFFMPGLVPEHARVAIETAEAILRVTGHGDASGPWAPVGAGIHTGMAFVGAVGSEDTVVDITALGDTVNTAARLASMAGPGEVIVSEDTCLAAGLDRPELERRQLDLKGRSEPVDVRVISVNPS